MDQFDVLKIENQLCFPLYACAKEVVRKYTPYLYEIDLTYTQYITMMVLWEYGQMNVKELGEWLYLDSGTLSPLLKKLEGKGLITRRRLETDERQMTVEPTPRGMKLRKQAVRIPAEVGKCIDLTQEEIGVLHQLLYKVLEGTKIR